MYFQELNTWSYPHILNLRFAASHPSPEIFILPNVEKALLRKVSTYSAQSPFLVSCRSSRADIVCQCVLTEELWNLFSLLLIFTNLAISLIPTTNMRLLKEKALCKDLESHSGIVFFPPWGAQMSWDVNCLFVHSNELGVSEILIILKWWICILKLSHRFLNLSVDSARSGSHMSRTHWSN